MNDRIPQQDHDKSAARRGVTLNAVSTSDALNAWLAHHRFSARMSLQKMIAEPGSALMTSLIIGIALALPVSLFVVSENIKTLSGRWDDTPQISIYLRQSVPPAKVLLFGNKLQQNMRISNVVYVSPEAALEEFKQYLSAGNNGFGEAFKLLDENPLPHVYIAKPISNNAEELAALSQQLQSYPEVEFVQMDLDWVKKLQKIITLAERFIFLFGFMLCLGVLLTIGNTIRLMIENRREEIVVVKLVGGTDAFVRRPLLYSGLWYGLTGGLVAWVLILLCGHLLSGPAQQLALLYGSDFSPKSPGLPFTLLLLSISALLGLAGSWMATTRYLHQAQPR